MVHLEQNYGTVMILLCSLRDPLISLEKDPKDSISPQLKIAVFPKDPKLDQNFHPQVSLVL